MLLYLTRSLETALWLIAGCAMVAISATPKIQLVSPNG
jgi:hypothetical protein